MGGGHYHHGRGARRGRRPGGRSAYYIAGGDDDDLLIFDIDAGPLERAAVEAADLLPTFVTPTDAINYIQETDVGFSRLDRSVTQSTVSDAFKASWAAELAAWRVFAAGARASVGWLNTKAIMDQTDRWSADLKNWDQNFQAQGGKDIGPPPVAPGQGTPTGTAVQISDVTKLIAAGGALAALIIFGPKLMKG